MGDVSENFDREEFMCKCGCGFDGVDSLLVERLQMVRNALKESIHIRSGCRCEKHNLYVGGSKNSAHTRGKAADVWIPNSQYRYRFLKQAFKLFTRIEVPDGPWIHVDVDETLPQEVCFTKS